ncbi:hypothetical protein HYW41_00305 [Candidatus Daviesbacteria bacterium]|nr:hypothetical protein [Candidatus Daviesbacteria bacterium]
MVVFNGSKRLPGVSKLSQTAVLGFSLSKTDTIKDMAEGVGGGPEAPGQRRFDVLMGLNKSLVFRVSEVLGAEDLGEIPAHLPLIIATSHFSDADVQTVESVLRPQLKKVRPGHGLGITLQSDNFRDLRTALPIKLVGKEHFFPLDAYPDEETGHLRFRFNPENFDKMTEALQKGTDLIISAHEPLSNITGLSWELPGKSGLGAAYLAQRTNATLLPVAVDIQTDQPVAMSADVGGTIKRLIKGQRPKVRVIIGQPFNLDQTYREAWESFEKRYAACYGKAASRTQVETLTAEEKNEERVRYGQVKEHIRKQSDLVMKKIADLLPKRKRGVWR